jgi:hypothetical protein
MEEFIGILKAFGQHFLGDKQPAAAGVGVEIIFGDAGAGVRMFYPLYLLQRYMFAGPAPAAHLGVTTVIFYGHLGSFLNLLSESLFKSRASPDS